MPSALRVAVARAKTDSAGASPSRTWLLINVLPMNPIVGEVDVRAAVVRGLDLLGLEQLDMPVGEEVVPRS